MSESVKKQNKAVLLISHGSSDLTADRSCSDLFYTEIKEHCPDIPVYQAYSAPKTLQRIDREEAQTPVSTIPEAMERIQADEITDLRVLAVNLNPSFKHTKVRKTLEPFAASFERLTISPPLLNADTDPQPFAKELADIIGESPLVGTDMVLLFAHTATDEVRALWQPVLDLLQAQIPVPVRLIYHKGKPNAKDLIEELSAEDGKRSITIFPMMLFGGRHLKKDLLEGEASLSAALEKAGHTVRVSPHGLGEYPQIRALFYKYL